jgi:hypothetical protein
MAKTHAAGAPKSASKPQGSVAVTRRADSHLPPPDHAGFEEVRRLGFKAMRTSLAKRRKHK